MKISKRERIFIFITILFVIIGLYFNLFYKKINGEIRDYKSKIQTAKNDLNSALKAEDDLTELHRVIENLENMEKKLPVYYYENNIEADMAVFLENAIEGLGLGTRIRFNEIQKENMTYLIPVTISIESNYHNLKRILKNIEGSPWPFTIKSFKANKRGQDPGSYDYDWNVETLIEFIAF